MASDSESEEDLSSATSSLEDDEDGSDGGLPADIKSISFGELEDIRMKIGTKKFDAAVHKQATQTTEEKVFTRRNKNRPAEQSSKKRVPLLHAAAKGKKKVRRDPRFDDLSGRYNPDLFEKSYEFLESHRAKEKKQLKREMRETKNPHRKAEIQQLLTRMHQQGENVKRQKEQQLVKQQVQKQRQALLKQGKKPFYMKKGAQRKLEIETKFAELKKKGKLDRFMEKKRKRNAARDRKAVPVAE